MLNCVWFHYAYNVKITELKIHRVDLTKFIYTPNYLNELYS